MDVQILDRDGNDNSILYKFSHPGRQNAIVAAGFYRFERVRISKRVFQHYRPIPGTYWGKDVGVKRTFETCCKLFKNVS
jgi:hypothetical protein